MLSKYKYFDLVYMCTTNQYNREQINRGQTTTQVHCTAGRALITKTQN